jgi:hypothetical protein
MYMMSLKNSGFEEFLHLIYPNQLEVNDIYMYSIKRLNKNTLLKHSTQILC